eukprot:497179-Pelagomonas_calceolata.AAC.4
MMLAFLLPRIKTWSSTALSCRKLRFASVNTHGQGACLRGMRVNHHVCVSCAVVSNRLIAGAPFQKAYCACLSALLFHQLLGALGGVSYAIFHQLLDEISHAKGTLCMPWCLTLSPALGAWMEFVMRPFTSFEVLWVGFTCIRHTVHASVSCPFTSF